MQCSPKFERPINYVCFGVDDPPFSLQKCAEIWKLSKSCRVFAGQREAFGFDPC